MANTIRVHKSQSLTSIQVSASFYERMYSLCEFIVGNRGQEELLSAKAQIENDQVTEEWVKHYETTLQFLAEFDRMALEQGNIEEVTEEEYLQRNQAYQQGKA